MGSDSDWPVMEAAAEALKEFDVAYEADVVSAHRMPDEMLAYGREAADRGLSVIIAGAGGAAHLPGMLASVTPLPVIGVPVPLEHLDGMDSLLSIVQMPAGVPVATVARRQRPQRRAARRTHPGRGRRRPAAADARLPGRPASYRAGEGQEGPRVVAAARRLALGRSEVRPIADRRGDATRSPGRCPSPSAAPAAVVRRNASASTTPSWNHTALRADRHRLVGELTGRVRAPEHVDHVDREGHVGERRVAAARRAPRSCRSSAKRGWIGTIRLPRRWSSSAMEYAVRPVSPDRPTTAQVSRSSSIRSTHSSRCHSPMSPA